MLDQTMLSYYLYRLLGLVVPLIPSSLVGYPLATRLGDFLYGLEKGRRANIYDNVTHILGGSPKEAGDIEAIVRGVFRSMARNYYDLFRVPTLSLTEIARLVKVEGWEHVEKALSRGKGLIIVTAHFGGADIVAQVLARREIPVIAPAEHLKPEVLVLKITGCKGLSSASFGTL